MVDVDKRKGKVTKCPAQETNGSYDMKLKEWKVMCFETHSMNVKSVVVESMTSVRSRSTRRARLSNVVQKDAKEDYFPSYKSYSSLSNRRQQQQVSDASRYSKLEHIRIHVDKW